MKSRPVVPIVGRININTGNPGDVYILLGLQYLIESAIGPYAPLLLDKFSENQFLTHETMVRDAGYVVIAGTPQFNCYSDWCFWYDDKIWDHFRSWGVKAIPLAGGAGFPDPRMTPSQFTARCMNDQKTVDILKNRRDLTIYQTVRDTHAGRLIEAMDIQGEIIPCSALFVAEKLGITSSRMHGDNKVVLVPCSPSAICGNIGGSDVQGYHRNIFRDLYAALKKDHEVLVLCHGFSEYTNLRGTVPVEDIFVTNDHVEIMRVYAEFGTVVSARLHGAIASAGIGGIRVQHIAVDTRCSAISVLNSWTEERSYMDNVAIDAPSLVDDVVKFVNEEARVAINVSDTHLIAEAYRKVIRQYFPNAPASCRL